MKTNKFKPGDLIQMANSSIPLSYDICKDIASMEIAWLSGGLVRKNDRGILIQEARGTIGGRYVENADCWIVLINEKLCVVSECYMRPLVAKNKKSK